MDDWNNINKSKCIGAEYTNTKPYSWLKSPLQPLGALKALDQVRHKLEGGHAVDHVVIKGDGEVQDVALLHLAATQEWVNGLISAL